MSIPSDLRSRVLELPQADRAELAHELILSLEPEGPELDRGYEEVWAAELEKRVRDFEEGRSEAIPWREALDEIRQSLRQGRPT